MPSGFSWEWQKADKSFFTIKILFHNPVSRIRMTRYTRHIAFKPAFIVITGPLSAEEVEKCVDFLGKDVIQTQKIETGQVI